MLMIIIIIIIMILIMIMIIPSGPRAPLGPQRAYSNY